MTDEPTPPSVERLDVSLQTLSRDFRLNYRALTVQVVYELESLRITFREDGNPTTAPALQEVIRRHLQAFARALDSVEPGQIAISPGHPSTPSRTGE